MKVGKANGKTVLTGKLSAAKQGLTGKISGAREAEGQLGQGRQGEDGYRREYTFTLAGTSPRTYRVRFSGGLG